MGYRGWRVGRGVGGVGLKDERLLSVVDRYG